MKILITGGAGSLGSNLAERYLERGHELMLLDNFATGREESLPPALARLHMRRGNVADSAFVASCFEEFEPGCVIHAAASYKDPDDWQSDAACNVGGTINVVRAAEAAGVRRLVYLQTALCYGRPRQVPVPVDHPLAPFTSYGVSKTAGEHYALMAKLPVVSLRLANVTGPRLTIGPIPTFYKRLKAGQGCFCSETVRDFLDMEDFFSLMDMCLADGAPTGVFNVSTGEGHTIREVFDIVARYLDLTPPSPPSVPCGPDDVPAMVLDPAKTEQAFGWRAEYGFEETLARMLRWYDEHGVTHIYSHLRAPRLQTEERKLQTEERKL